MNEIFTTYQTKPEWIGPDRNGLAVTLFITKIRLN